jgi:hypothetical protein
MIPKDKITILYTYWNTPEELWRESFKSALNQGVNITIVNDQSSKEYLNLLNRSITELVPKNFKHTINIITPPKKLQQEGATFYGAERITTPYIIRMDSDDIIYNIPTLEKEVDVIQGRPSIYRSLRGILIGRHCSFNGNVCTKEVVQSAYADWTFMKEYHNYWHEDVYAGLYLLLTNPDIKIKYSGKITYRGVYLKEHKLKKSINWKVKRIETLMAVCSRLGIPYKKYEEYKNIIINSTLRSAHDF